MLSKLPRSSPYTTSTTMTMITGRYLLTRSGSGNNHNGMMNVGNLPAMGRRPSISFSSNTASSRYYHYHSGNSLVKRIGDVRSSKVVTSFGQAGAGRLGTGSGSGLRRGTGTGIGIGTGTGSGSAMCRGPILISPFHSTTKNETIARRRKVPVVKPFLLADIGEGITEVEVIKWCIPLPPPTQITRFQPLLEVQSDKASVEITSPFDGKIVSVECQGEGDVIKVGEVICSIEVEEEDGGEMVEEGGTGNGEAIHEGIPSTSQGQTQAHPSSTVTSPGVPEEDNTQPISSSSSSSATTTTTPLLATPAVRRIAREHRIDLNDPKVISSIRVTGKGGRVTKEDLMEFVVVERERLKKGSSTSEAATVADGNKDEAVVAGTTTVSPSTLTNAAKTTTTATGEEGGLPSWMINPSADVENRKNPSQTDQKEIPLDSVRRSMYKAMSSSLQIPHFTYSDEIDLTQLEKLRVRLNGGGPAGGSKSSSGSSVPLKFRKSLNKREEGIFERGGIERVPKEWRYDRMTMLPLLVKAMSLAIMEGNEGKGHPLFRSRLVTSAAPSSSSSSSSQQQQQQPYFIQNPQPTISVALSSPAGGLFTPSLPNAHFLSPWEIASQITYLQSLVALPSSSSSGLSSTATPPKFPPQFRAPGTITLSNIGNIGGTYLHPVIPPTGQLAIGALGRSRVLPRYMYRGEPASTTHLGRKAALEESLWGENGRTAGGDGEEEFVDDLEVKPRLVMEVSFSGDHRVMEGVELAQLVKDWKELLERPERMIGWGK